MHHQISLAINLLIVSLLGRLLSRYVLCALATEFAILVWHHVWEVSLLWLQLGVYHDNSSSHINRLLPAESSLNLFVHSSTWLFIQSLFGWSSALDLSPNSNLFVVVVVIEYESANLSTASFLCIEELDWLHFYTKDISIVDSLTDS